MSQKDISSLPDNTRIMHESQEKWRDSNWKDTLEEHKSEIEELMQKINLFDIWSNSLQDNAAARRLIPEIFMDGYISIHLAGYGLYKYANICLRSQLETTLRLIYFSTHPVEFDWWCKGNEWYREGLATKDVWGERYGYFTQLEYVKKFEKKCTNHKKLFAEGQRVSKIYQKLSRYVHTSAFSFQTKPDDFAPKHKIKEFAKWIDNFKEIQEYINLLLILGFAKEFEKLNSTSQERIRKTAIESPHYEEKLREVLGSGL